MRFKSYFPWYFAALWTVLRLVLRNTVGITEARNAAILINILMILTVVFLSMWFFYRQRPAPVSSFLEDVKRCVRNASMYIIGVAIGMGLYYGVMTNDIEELRNAHTLVRLEEISTEEGLQAYVSATRSDPGISRAAAEHQIIQDVHSQISLSKQLLFGIPLLLVASIFYALLTVVFWRQVLLK
jgi:hypothetical protein